MPEEKAETQLEAPKMTVSGFNEAMDALFTLTRDAALDPVSLTAKYLAKRGVSDSLTRAAETINGLLDGIAGSR